MDHPANPAILAENEQLTSRKVGDVSKTWGKGASADRRGYEATRFGVEYQRLLRGLGPSVRVI